MVPSITNRFLFMHTAGSSEGEPADGAPNLPTIRDAAHGWGLPLDELQHLLADDPTWEYMQLSVGELGGLSPLYRNTVHGYAQRWEYNEAGELEHVVLLILPRHPHLVEAFFVGTLHEEHEPNQPYFYPEYPLEYPDSSIAPVVYMLTDGDCIRLVTRFVPFER